MQEKNYKKFYFLDSKNHKPNEILAKIQKEHFIGVVFRKNQNFETNFTKTVLKICRQKKIMVFSHYSNYLPCDVLHLGGEPRILKTTTEAKRRRRVVGMDRGVCSFVWHKSDDFKTIARIKPNYVFISPVFATQTHPEIKPLGILKTIKVARIIKKIMPNCKIILLGGMTDKRFCSIKKMDCNNLFYGFAGVRF